jgi:hypothetical protein
MQEDDASSDFNLTFFLALVATFEVFDSTSLQSFCHCVI